MDKEILLSKKAELEEELDHLNSKKHWTDEEERRVHEIKKMKLKIKDLLKNH